LLQDLRKFLKYKENKQKWEELTVDVEGVGIVWEM